MASRGVRPARRGRAGLLAVGLAAFVLVATGVIWRRSEGLARARAQQALERRREALVAQQRRLESDVRDVRSRRRLGALAEARLGMRVPSAGQLVYLARPSTRTVPVDSQ